MEFNHFLNTYKEDYLKTLMNLNSVKIEEILDQMIDARNKKRTIFVIGNGGSAASASHWVCDFNKGATNDEHHRFRVTCLADNTPIVTALGNDVSYDMIFVNQMRNLLEAGDLVIALSVSGRSQNLIEAVSYANSKGATTISIVGDYEGQLKSAATHSLVVPSKNYGIVEDVHMYIAHVLSQYLAEHEITPVEHVTV